MLLLFQDLVLSELFIDNFLIQTGLPFQVFLMALFHSFYLIIELFNNFIQLFPVFNLLINHQTLTFILISFQFHFIPKFHSQCFIVFDSFLLHYLVLIPLRQSDIVRVKRERAFEESYFRNGFSFELVG